MRIQFLGTGTSTGVPEIGCKCEVCTSPDHKDKRLRASALLTINNKNILIDCGPDFREQMLTIEFKPIEGVLITHEHYDHVGGIDDLRPFCRFGDINIYAEEYVCTALKERIPYCFTESKYPGVPDITLNAIDNKPFSVDNIEVLPVRVMHHKLPIWGYRIGKFAYLTDMKTLPESEYSKLEGLDVLVISALRHKEHLSHQTLEEALIQIKKIAPKRAYLTHMSHHIGLHEDVQKDLPQNVYLAYDGLIVDL